MNPQKENLKRLRQENRSLKKRIKKLEAEKEKYESTVFYSAYSTLRSVKRKVKSGRNAEKNKQPQELPTISVVIPTYRINPYIEGCVNSVLQQDYDKDKIKIIISVNGKDPDYAKSLSEKYSSEKNIRVIYREKQGAGAARNYAKSFVETEGIIYLDDDDYFSRGYLKALARQMTDDVEIVCGRITDVYSDGRQNTDTYINDCLEEAKRKGKYDYLNLSGCFSTVCTKLYRSSLIIKKCVDFNEEISHTEDVLFWVENIDKIEGKISVCTDKEASYMRRILEGSRSRPQGDEIYCQNIIDRIAMAERYTAALMSPGKTYEYRCFVRSKIDASNTFMEKAFRDLNEEDKERARERIFRSDCLFINKSKFAVKKGIAFCHNFTPSVDASAFVASKRLEQISLYLGEEIGWTVVCADMSGSRKMDRAWDDFYAKFHYTEKITTEGNTYFNEKSQVEWGRNASTLVKDEDVSVIYSRSMFAGSHVAAYHYKESHPQVHWIAEFSDPLSMGTDNCPRPASKTYEGEWAFLRTFWRDLEQTVFKNADEIIFTNQNQLDYMLQCNPASDNDRVRSRALVWHHPVVAPIYAQIRESTKNINKEDINIAYFGTFYPNRDVGEMLLLLARTDIHLHIFTNVTSELRELGRNYKNLHMRSMVTQLEMLNLAHRMDYCFLSDIRFDGEICPYLPSKLADYLSADVPIIALVQNNTPMAKLEHPNLIKIHEINLAFIKSLHKRDLNF